MRSTHQYLNNPFKPEWGSRQGRLTQLEDKLKKSISPPERYLDAITNIIMEAPCNIKQDTIMLKDSRNNLVRKTIDAPDFYIDARSREQYETHPLDRDPKWHKNWRENKYTVDTKLSANIEAWLTIEEMKIYVNRLEEIRKQEPQTYLQAATSAEILQIYGREQEQIPEAFRSMSTGNKIMTLPVKLDGKHMIDFQELLDCQPKHEEYLNPLTNEPIQSIQIEFDLLKRLDDLMNPLQEQIRIVKKQVEAFSLKPFTKTYAKILEEKKYPNDRIPESLALGRIPGNIVRLELMTHPVLLDGEFMIDFERLIAYWENKNIFSIFWDTSRHGYNPFTEQPIKSISYDVTLKKHTDHFMANLKLQQKFLTQEEVRSANYRYGCLGFFISTHSVIPNDAELTPVKSKA